MISLLIFQDEEAFKLIEREPPVSTSWKDTNHQSFEDSQVDTFSSDPFIKLLDKYEVE